MFVLAVALVAAPIDALKSLTDDEFCAHMKDAAAAQHAEMTIDCPSKLVGLVVKDTLKKNPAKDAVALKRLGWRLVCKKPGVGVSEFTRRGWHYKLTTTYSDGTVVTTIVDCSAGPPA